MKNIIIAFCILIIPLKLLSQSHEDVMINAFWDFYSFNYLNTESAGRGFTGIAADNNISGILLNPASVNLSAKYQINVQYTYKTSNPWLTSFSNDIYIKHQLFSGSVGFGWNVNDKLLTGLVYNNPTGMYFSGPKATNLNGTEVEYYNDVKFHSLNVPLVYKAKNYRLGINLNYIYALYTVPGEVYYPPVSGTFSATNHFFRASLGLSYIFKNGLSFGLRAISGGRGKVTYENPPGIAGEEETADAIYPWKAGAGLQYDLKAAKFKMLFDFNFTYHNQDNLKERYDFNFGIEKEIEKNWIIRGGFFTLLDYRSKDANWIDPIGDYNQYFLTLGFGLKQKNFEANISALTSEISPGKIKSIYINGGLSFNF